MKRLVFKILFILIILTPLWSFFVWWFWPSSILNGLVIDKNERSLSNQSQASHWILNNEKTNHNNGESYDPAGEERNEIPSIADFSSQQLDSLSDELEMLYFVQVSGSQPLETFVDSLNSNDSLDKMAVLSEKEISLMLKMKGKAKLVLAEYNTLLNPESAESRLQLEEIFQLEFSGWVGKYFNDLSAPNPEIPDWLKENYASFTGEEYAFPESKGLILCHSSGKVLVLEEEVSMLNALPMIHTDMDGMENYELPNFVGYPFWFDINEAQNEEDIISSYKLQTNKKGDSILNRHGIPNKFPAVIGPQKGAFNYYFCGDFADNPVLEKLSYFKGVSLISRLLYVVADESDRKAFFWNFYKPLMRNIFNNFKNQESLEVNSDSISFYEAVDSLNAEQDSLNVQDATMGEVVDSNQVREKEVESPTVRNASGDVKAWRIVIASLKSQEGTEKYLKQLNNPEISAVWVGFLETNRIAFGPYLDIREAQLKYQQILQTYPEAWMIKF